MALKFPDILQHNNSSYALVDSSQIRGTAYTITNLSNTGSIPTDKRNTGIIVFVSSEQKYYGYYGSTVNTSDWDNVNNWRTIADGENATTLGSITTGSLNTNQTILGSLTVNQNIFGSASFATQSLSSSTALTASYTPNAIITASVSQNILTFKKGNGTEFNLTVNTGSNSANNFLGSITSGQILYNNSTAFAGVPTLTYNGTILTATGSFTGSFSGSLFGTASFASTSSFTINSITSSIATSAITSSYPFSQTGSTIYSVNSNVFDGIIYDVPFHNNFIVGELAGILASLSHSMVVGNNAGIAAASGAYNIFIGESAGAYSTDVSHSTFLGSNSGYQSQADNAVFIGRESGYRTTNSINSIFIGYRTGYSQQQSSQSIFLGYNVGNSQTGAPLGSNNIIIGTNIGLPANTQNSINLGGIIFATGSHSIPFGNTLLNPVNNARVGINIIPRIYNFEVSGTTNITNGLYVTNSINLTGSNNHIGNYILTGSILSTGSNTFTGNTTISGSLLTSGSNTFTGQQTISGSLNVLNDLTVLGSASFYYFTTTFVTTSTIIATGSNQLGDTLDDVQTLIGTVNISGSLVVTGSALLTASNVNGGSSSYIPIWKTENSLGTSSIYQSSENVLIGTTTNPNTDFKLHVSGNLSVNEFQISTFTSSQNLNYVGIYRQTGSAGYTNFLETSLTESQHKWVFRGINGFGQKRFWDKNNSSIVNINLGWDNPTQTLFTGSTLLINPHINLTDGSATMIRGIYYNPTISASVNTNHIAIETTTGSIIFKNIPTSNTAQNVLLYDAVTGQLFYTASNSITAVSPTGSNATGSFTELSTWTFTHNLNNKYVLIQAYDTSWNQIIPQSITLTDTNTATITFPTPESGYAIAMLGGEISLSNYVTNSGTASFVINTTFNSFTASTNTFTQSILNWTGSVATTGSNTFKANQIITGSLSITGSVTVTGNIIPGGPYTANTSSYSLGTPTAAWKDIYVSNGSVVFISGSTTSSINLGPAGVLNFTGSLQGTASFASTASYVNTLNQNVIITGSLTVGQTSAGASENTLTLAAKDNGSEGGQLGLNAPGGTYTSASFIDNYANTFRILAGTTNANSTAELVKVNLGNGNMTLNAGSVIMPTRPAFRVVGAQTGGAADKGANSILSGSLVTVDYNQGSYYNNTNGEFTCPLAGLYHVWYVGRSQNAVGPNSVAILKNNGTVLTFWENNGTNIGHFGTSAVVNLAANDIVTAKVTAGTITFDTNDNWGVAYIG